ncbi:Alanine--tRNA ligase [Buchnera aphidicola (Eriosoma grossulariae)]|uniref:alanine--tRNA ligase n=1 Tax=Buchnera aphidicola TaxID=9 RepID=UPI003464BB20
MKINTNDIRKMFLTFFKKKGHEIMASSSLIPENDSTLLFTNAGMNQFKDIFLGQNKNKYTRVATIQKCLRTGGKHNDLDNIGYSENHHTFFEMLGNFSFGDYFKKEAILYAWELLTSEKWFNLNQNRLWVTVYHKDQETYNIWINTIKLPKNKVVFIKDNKNSQFNSDNFWQMGDYGPCGPSTEIFYDTTNAYLNNSINYCTNTLKGQVEIWNIVFMEYNRTYDGQLIKLPIPSVDTGMGLERITRILQNKKSNYEIDIFEKIIKSIIQFNPNININEKKSIHIIADHIRSASFLISENILPSNEGRGYVLRRIIRRALRHAYTSGMNKLFFYKLVPTLIQAMEEESLLIKKREKIIQNILKQEEIQFNYTISRGIKLLKSKIQKMKGKILNGKTIFKLYDTFGFPIDLTADFCKEYNLKIDYEGFKKEMSLQKKQTRKSNMFKNNHELYIDIKHHSIFVGYNKYEIKSTIQQIFVNGISVKKLTVGESGIIILNQTPFYPESGGQIGDIGIILKDENVFEVKNTKKHGIGIGHYGILKSGEININQLITAKINIKNRILIQNNHSATHLLHSTLRNIFGENTVQKGSLVNDSYLRFDFVCYQKITIEIIQKIENIINYYILKNIPINTTIDTFNNAKQKGILALFHEKYNDIVRIVSINNYSVELCGGTHSSHTGNIGLFKIINEKSIGSGIRRIEAITGKNAVKFIQKKEIEIKNIINILNANENNVLDKIKILIEKNKILEKKIEYFTEIELINIKNQLIKKNQLINNINILIENVHNFNIKLLRTIIDKIKLNLNSSIIILTTVNKNKIYFIINISKTLNNNIQANKIAKKIIAHIGGKGGGNPSLSEGGGGEKIELLSSTLNNIKQWIIKKINQ